MVDAKRRPSRIGLIATVLAMTACAQAVSTEDLQGVVVEQPQPKPSFVLTDTEGGLYDFAAETEGKLTLLYFGYLNCPDICPVHLAQIAETLERIPAVAREAEVVFVSVDPGRDSPREIRDFLDNFDPRFVGLTGTEEELVVAQIAAGVPPAVIVGNDDGYTVDHAAWVIAYGPDGLNHAIYPSGTRQSQWENDLQVLAEMTGDEAR